MDKRDCIQKLEDMIEEGISKELIKEQMRPHHLARSLKISRFSVQKLLQLRTLLQDVTS